MIKNLMNVVLLIFTLILSMNSHAFEIAEPISVSIPVTKKSSNTVTTSQLTEKEVTLNRIRLTEQERQILDKTNSTKISMKSSDEHVPSAVYLGMNGVPVLEQGRHGTCVTFAITAAIDAVLGQGDYVSQLCNLELGRYLANQSYRVSGWEGIMDFLVIDQIIRFGIINKNNQHEKSCAGITEYPTHDQSNQGNPMSIEEFMGMSEDLVERLYPVPWMTPALRFSPHFPQESGMEKLLYQVKKALVSGDRLTIGTFVYPFLCDSKAGACARFHKKNDTWALTHHVDLKNVNIAGHTMLITGYDDMAVAVDDNGTKHQGLLILRNSWGEEVGDNGDFYMTYDYFKKFVNDIHEVVKVDE